MCGRFTLTTPGEILAFAFMVDDVEAGVSEMLDKGGRYNLCPTDDVVAVVGRRPRDGGGRKAGLCRWGLVPAWAEDVSIGARMFNARAETLADKPSFRRALVKRRCVVPADGFFEWRRGEGGGKTPLFIRRRDGKPLALAGLWERWRDRSAGAGQGQGRGGGAPGDWVRSCTVVTRPPNAFMSGIHNRMPCMLDDDSVAAWLDPRLQGLSVGGGDPAARSAVADGVLGRVIPADLLEAYEVSAYVNRAGNEGKRCIEPVPGGVRLKGAGATS